MQITMGDSPAGFFADCWAIAPNAVRGYQCDSSRLLHFWGDCAGAGSTSLHRNNNKGSGQASSHHHHTNLHSSPFNAAILSDT